MRIQNFNELKYKIRSNDFKNIISRKMKPPQTDTVRDALKVIDVEGLYKLHSKIIKKAKRNKTFDEGTIDGYIVVAIDDPKLFHSAAFMSLIGKEPKLIMDFELYKGSEDSSKKDAGELTVAKRLLSRVVNIFRRLSGGKLKGLTQKEIVRLLEKELYLLKYSRQYVFDTT